MPIRPDAPLRKVTLNLYDEDCRWLEREYGRGWSERVRQHIHNEVVKRTIQYSNRQTPTKLGDLADD